MRIFIFLIAVLFLTSTCNLPAREELTPEEIARDKKMEWWREARFGMFIHWGLYAVPGGEWKGEKIPGISEWIMLKAQIPIKEYEGLAGQFNPVKFDAEAWVKLAKDAGMKYIVITSKHHDGFAMFHSQASKYNIFDATPFNRDPLQELAKACKKYGVKLGFYYSQAQDWHEPGGTYPGIGKGKPHWDKNLGQEPFMDYINRKAVPQVKEILENYGGLDILWWDTPIGMTEQAATELRQLTESYPEMLQNNRLYKNWKGDFSTPEQHVPPTGLGYDWEVCMTMNTSWGYKYYDQNWKSAEAIIHMIVDIASKGGNLLLNVGPDALGQIPDSCVVRLKKIGEWLNKNGSSIYGTTASPFYKLPWGRCTKREHKKGATLYFHVFEWPKDKILHIPGLRTRISDVYLASNPHQKFAYKFDKGDLLIHTPAVTFDAVNTVIAVETRGKLRVISNMPGLKNGKVFLPAGFADIYNKGYGRHAIIIGQGSKAYIKNWTDTGTKVEWMFNVPEPGDYKVSVYLKTKEANSLDIKIGKNIVQAEIPANNKAGLVELGSIKIDKAGDNSLRLSPVAGSWDEADIYYAELEKIE